MDAPLNNLSNTFTFIFRNKWHRLYSEFIHASYFGDDEACLIRIQEMNDFIIKKKLEGTNLHGITCCLYGELLAKNQKHEEAKKFLCFGKKYLENVSLREKTFCIRTLSCLGHVEMTLGNLKAAEDCFLESLNISKSLLQKKTDLYLSSLNDLCCFYYFQGNYAKGDVVFNEIKTFTDSEIINELNCRAYSLYASSLFFRSDHEEAITIYNKLIAFYIKNKSAQNELYLCYSQLALLSIIVDPASDIAKLMNKINQHIEQIKKTDRELYRLILRDIALIYFAKKNYTACINKLAPIIQELENDLLDKSLLIYLRVTLAKAYMLNDNAKLASKEFRDLLHDIKNFLLTWTEDLTQSEKYLIMQKTFTLMSGICEFLVRHGNNYPHLVTDYFDYLVTIKYYLYNDYKLLINEYKGFNHIREELNDDEAFIVISRLLNDISENDVQYLFMIVTRETIKAPDFIIIPNGLDLEHRFYEHYIDQTVKCTDDFVSFKIFWQPIYEKISNKKRIFISADGIYQAMNLEILQLDDGHFLLDKQECIIINGIHSVYKKTFGNSVEVKSALLAGNPNFYHSTQNQEQDYPKIKYKPLEYTAIEIEKSSKELFKIGIESKILVNEDVTKDNIILGLENELIHIATHATKLLTDSKNELEDLYKSSGLLLSKSIGIIDGEFGCIKEFIITPDEIKDISLSHVQLFILSACITGIGTFKLFGSMVGWSLALFSAGCKNVIFSLWKVDDEVTAEFMGHFYTEFCITKNPRRSMLYAKKIIAQKYKHPYYWGCFQLVSR